MWPACARSSSKSLSRRADGVPSGTRRIVEHVCWPPARCDGRTRQGNGASVRYTDRVSAGSGRNGPGVRGGRPGRRARGAQGRQARPRPRQDLPQSLRAARRTSRSASIHRHVVPVARPGRARRRPVSRPTLHPRRLARREARARGDPGRRGRREDLPLGGFRSRRDPCRRAHPPRRQAGQHPARRGRGRVHHGLRAGQGQPGHRPDQTRARRSARSTTWLPSRSVGAE